MIEVSFPAGFTPADATRVEATFTRSAISRESPACSANAITGTRPAHDTTCSSSNSGVALDHTLGSSTDRGLVLGSAAMEKSPLVARGKSRFGRVKSPLFVFVVRTGLWASV